METDRTGNKPTIGRAKCRRWAVIIFSALAFLRWAPALAEYYGAPYRYTLGCVTDHPPFDAIDSARTAWWERYVGCYPIAENACAYRNKDRLDGKTTGIFATMSLTGACSGGDRIVGTAYGYDPGKNNGPPPCRLGVSGGVSNPVNVFTGNKFQREVDLDGGHPGALPFVRYYNSSRATRWESMGALWRHTYERELVYREDDTGNARISIYRPNGRIYDFVLTASGWIADADVPERLESLTHPDGTRAGWRYFTTTNEIETYDDQGKLQLIRKRNGLEWTLVWDTNTDVLQGVESSTGESLSFFYDATGRLERIEDVAGRRWGYRYDEAGNLEYVDRPDGRTRQYHYEDPVFRHALTGITDARGVRYATYAYDARGRAIVSTHAGDAERVDIRYNSDGSRSLTNGRGQTSTYSRSIQLGVALLTEVSGPGCARCGPGDSRYRYDSRNHLIQKTQNGIRTRWGRYDAKGQYGCKVEGLTAADATPNDGTCAFDPAASPAARRTEYTYDPRFY